MTGAFCVEQALVHNSFVISTPFFRFSHVRNHYRKPKEEEKKNHGSAEL